ncbi:flagellar export chaperone FliS [Paenibacillus sedimenti]|uniref:Flagellar secretion chaperone FliS n=1 Tax=Paenibacillus sedimenti TaxID=2770274 RepID=A0A926QLQ5_9BACL|nr:flagellar export chaperone FliS [Paenibacillus sedimenti]MBD0384161.1 flagellar export chaperone FliS [Paenibacillus sedimenti]
MLNAQRNKYLETTIQTAGPSQLLIMLYDGAIRFCKFGIEAINQNNYEEANRNLCRAQEIIQELSLSLDRNADIAEGLLKLYEYFVYRLMESNIQKTPEQAQEVVQHLIELKETWIQASKLVTMQTASGVKNG